MANQQHIEWLLEGVEAWNARRAREDFVPDFSGADIFESFRSLNLLNEDDRIPLQTIDLNNAILVDAQLPNADLQYADLSSTNAERVNLDFALLSESDLGRSMLQFSSLLGTDLSNVNLGGAILSGAQLDSANLNNADLGGTDFGGSDIAKATFQDADATSIPQVTSGHKIETTNLENVENCTQEQLNSMLGDSMTRIPANLEQPKHWPEFDGDNDSRKDRPAKRIDLESGSFKLTGGDVEFNTDGSRAARVGLRDQAIFILKTANATEGSANLAAAQIETAIEHYCNESGVNGGEDVEILKAIAATFRNLATALDDNQSKDAKIQELQAIIAQLESEVDRLNETIRNGASTAKQILIGSLQIAGGSAITLTTSHILGQINPDLINNLWQLIGPENVQLSSPISPHTG